MNAEENKRMIIVIFLFWREIAFQIFFKTSPAIKNLKLFSEISTWGRVGLCDEY